jgi:hypothetical protein
MRLKNFINRLSKFTEWLILFLTRTLGKVVVFIFIYIFTHILYVFIFDVIKYYHFVYKKFLVSVVI